MPTFWSGRFPANKNVPPEGDSLDGFWHPSSSLGKTTSDSSQTSKVTLLFLLTSNHHGLPNSQILPSSLTYTLQSLCRCFVCQYLPSWSWELRPRDREHRQNALLVPMETSCSRTYTALETCPEVVEVAPQACRRTCWGSFTHLQNLSALNIPNASHQPCTMQSTQQPTSCLSLQSWSPLRFDWCCNSMLLDSWCFRPEKPNRVQYELHVINVEEYRNKMSFFHHTGLSKCRHCKVHSVFSSVFIKGNSLHFRTQPFNIVSSNGAKLV